MIKYSKNGDWRLIIVLLLNIYLCHDAASRYNMKSTRNCLENTKKRYFRVLTSSQRGYTQSLLLV